VIVEHVAGDQQKIDAVLRRFVAQLLQRHEAGFANPAASVLLKASYPEAEV
jgi:hypothetical protein